MVQQSVEIQIFIGLLMLALTGLAMGCAAASDDHEEAMARQRRLARRRARQIGPGPGSDASPAIHFRDAIVQNPRH